MLMYMYFAALNHESYMYIQSHMYSYTFKGDVLVVVIW